MAEGAASIVELRTTRDSNGKDRIVFASLQQRITMLWVDLLAVE
jgi:hypothetical protein